MCHLLMIGELQDFRLQNFLLARRFTRNVDDPLQDILHKNVHSGKAMGLFEVVQTTPLKK